jgi:hypothetical protein
MKETCWVTSKLIDSLQPQYASKMQGYRVHLKTPQDFVGGGSRPYEAIMDADCQCGSGCSPAYSWANLVHEFAHSAIDANEKNEEAKSLCQRGNGKYLEECFPWAVESWFNISNGRNSISDWEKKMVGLVFDLNDDFIPKCSR